MSKGITSWGSALLSELMAFPGDRISSVETGLSLSGESEVSWDWLATTGGYEKAGWPPLCLSLSQALPLCQTLTRSPKMPETHRTIS